MRSQQKGERMGGALTYIYTDDGELSFAGASTTAAKTPVRISFPTSSRIVWTSTRDNMDMDLGATGPTTRTNIRRVPSCTPPTSEGEKYPCA